MKLGTKDTAAIVAGLAGLSGPEAKAMVKRLAEYYGVSPSTIYRVSRAARPHKKQRGDANSARLELPREILDQAWGLLHDQKFSAERTLEIMEAGNVIPAGVVSASWLRREAARQAGGRGLREMRRLAARKLKPTRPFQNTHRRMEAEYPLQVVAIDFTRLQQFYLDEYNNLGYLSPFAHRKNKPAPARTEAWEYHAVDLYSRVRYSAVYPAMSATFVVDFLYNMMATKGDEFPFYGVPEWIRCDGDSRIAAKVTQRSLDALCIKLQVCQGNPNANGMVERSFLTTQDVQNGTRLHKLPLDDLGLMLRAEDIRYNWRKHSTTGQAPFQRFASGLAGHAVKVLDPEALADALMYDDFYPRVDNYLCIRLGGNAYQLPDVPPFNNMVRKRVSVHWIRRSAERAVISWLGRDYELALRPQIIVPAVGDHPHVPKANQAEQMLNRAVNTDVSSLDTWRYLLDQPRPRLLSAPATEPVDLAPAHPVIIPRVEALDEIKLRVAGIHGLLSVEQGRYLQERIPAEGCGRELIEELVGTLGESIAEESAG